MSGAVCQRSRHTRQLQYTMDNSLRSLAGFFRRVLLSGACRKRTSRALIFAPRARGRHIRASADTEAKKSRPSGFSRTRAKSRALAPESTGCAITAGASPFARRRFVVFTVEARLRRSSARTSKAPVERPARPKSSRRKRPAIETAADTVDTVGLAKVTLQAICEDFQAPAAARAQAARTLLELAGALKNATPDTARKAPAEMTLDEVNERLATLARDDA